MGKTSGIKVVEKKNYGDISFKKKMEYCNYLYAWITKLGDGYSLLEKSN